jgi:hypothetical protein
MPKIPVHLYLDLFESPREFGVFFLLRRSWVLPSCLTALKALHTKSQFLFRRKNRHSGNALPLIAGHVSPRGIRKAHSSSQEQPAWTPPPPFPPSHVQCLIIHVKWAKPETTLPKRTAVRGLIRDLPCIYAP